MSEWISVKDRLPKEGQVVMVKTIATIVDTYYESGDFDYNRICQAYANNSDIEGATANKVTHWKPIKTRGQ